MSKKLIALALFAVMVLSLVPFASAAVADGNVIKIELVNANTTTNLSDDPGDVAKRGSEIGSGTNVLTINEKFSELRKSGQDYYTDSNVKMDVYAYVSFASLVGGTGYTVNGVTATQTQLETALAIGTSGTEGSALMSGLAGAEVLAVVEEIKDLVNFSNLTVGGSKISSTNADEIHLAQVKSGNDYYLAVRVKVGSFEFTKADKTQTYEVKYVYGTGSGARTTTIQANWTNGDGAAKPVKDLYFKAVRTGDQGVYSIYEQNGVLYIDYDNTISISPRTVIPVNFTFFEDAARTVRYPASGQKAYITADSEGVLFNVSAAKTGTDAAAAGAGGNYTTIIGSDATQANFDASLNTQYEYTNNDYANKGAGAQTVKINELNISSDGKTPANKTGANRIPVLNNAASTVGVVLPANRTSQTNGKILFVVDGKDYEYETAEVKVVFRPLPRNVITTAVVSTPDEITIKKGESYTIVASSASATTYTNLGLSEITSVKPLLYIDNMTVTGTEIGTTHVQILHGTRVLDQVTVHVVSDVVAPTAPTESAASWRVIARTLNVRTGPGTNYGKVATLTMNTIVTGEDMGNGWVQIGTNQYVSKSWLTPVSVSANTVGSYTVNASSLNVRSGPGSSYAKIGSLPRNSVIEVVSVQNGWSQIASGGWVASMYLK